MQVNTIEVRTHGRYLVEQPDGQGPFPMLVGFHGYAENAERLLDALTRIRGERCWLLVSVQALHPFYNRDNDVVASWMTRQDRELAIADNIAYVGTVIAAVRRSHPTTETLVYTGFSQGVATAYRAAAFVHLRGATMGTAARTQGGAENRIEGETDARMEGGTLVPPAWQRVPPASGAILLAGDIPPDVAPVITSLPPVLIGRGTADQWYTEPKAAADLALFHAARIAPAMHVFEGGHVWDESFVIRAGEFLDSTATVRPVNGPRSTVHSPQSTVEH